MHPLLERIEPSMNLSIFPDFKILDVLKYADNLYKHPHPLGALEFLKCKLCIIMHEMTTDNSLTLRNLRNSHSFYLKADKVLIVFLSLRPFFCLEETNNFQELWPLKG